MSGSHNTHARLSPSAASRWTRCTASIAYNEHLRSEGALDAPSDSDYSLEGTSAHDLAEAALRILLIDKGELPRDFYDGFEPVREYVDHCVSLVEEGDLFFIEAREALFYAPDEKGTVDFLVIKASGDIIVRDLKYGQGIPVSSDRNKQLAIYAYSAVKAKEGKDSLASATNTVDIAAVQPRIDGDIEPWVLTVEDLAIFCLTEIQPHVDTINRGVNVKFFDREDVCRFCPAFRSQRCKHVETKANEGLPSVIDFDYVKDEDRDRYGRYADVVISFYKRAKEFVQEKFDFDGEVPSGYKVVAGRAGNRKWSDEQAAAQKLAEHVSPEKIYKNTLISPTQAAKLLSKSEMKEIEEQFVVRPEGKDKIVPDTDGRPAILKDTDLLPTG